MGNNVYRLHNDASAAVASDDCGNAGYVTISESDPPTVQIDKTKLIDVHVEQPYMGYTYLPQYQLHYSTANGFYAEVDSYESRVVHNVETIDECIQECDTINTATSGDLNYRCKGVAVSTEGEDVTICKRGGIEGTQLCSGNCIVYREYLGDDTFESSGRATRDNFRRLHFRKNGSQSESETANNCVLVQTNDPDASSTKLTVDLLTGGATGGANAGTHPCHQRNKVILSGGNTYTSDTGSSYTHQSEHWYDKLDTRDSISTTGIGTLEECINECDRVNSDAGTMGYKCKGVSYATGTNNVPDLTSKCALWGSKMGTWTFSHEAFGETNGANEFSLIHMKHDAAHTTQETVGACPSRTVYKPDTTQIAYETVADVNRELDIQTQYYAVPVISSNVDPLYDDYRNGVCEYEETTGTWSEDLSAVCREFGGLSQCDDTTPATSFVYSETLPTLDTHNVWTNVPSSTPVAYCTRADCKTLEKACGLSQTTYAVDPNGSVKYTPPYIPHGDEIMPYRWKQMEYDLIPHTCVKTMGDDGVCRCEIPSDGNTYYSTDVEACEALWGSLANEPVCDNDTYTKTDGPSRGSYDFANNFNRRMHPSTPSYNNKKVTINTDKCVLKDCIYHLGGSTDMYDGAIELREAADAMIAESESGSGSTASTFMGNILDVLGLADTKKQIRSALVEPPAVGLGYNARPELSTPGSIFSLCKKQIALMKTAELQSIDIPNANTYDDLLTFTQITTTDTLTPSYMRTLTFGGTTVESTEQASNILTALLSDIKTFEGIESTTIDGTTSDAVIASLRARQHALFCKYESTVIFNEYSVDAETIAEYISNMTNEPQKSEMNDAWTDIQGVGRLHRYIKNHFAVALLIKQIYSYIADIDALENTAVNMKTVAERYLKMRLLKFASDTDYKWNVNPNEHAELRDDDFFEGVHNWNNAKYEAQLSQAETDLDSNLKTYSEASIVASDTLYNVTFHICEPLIDWLGHVAELIEAETSIIFTYINERLGNTACTVPYYKTTDKTTGGTDRQHRWEKPNGDIYSTDIGEEWKDCGTTHDVGTYTLMTRLPIEVTQIQGTFSIPSDGDDVECTHTVPTDGHQPSRNDACRKNDPLFGSECDQYRDTPYVNEYEGKHWCELRCRRFTCAGVQD